MAMHLVAPKAAA